MNSYENRKYRIALKFRGSKFSQISRITGHSRNYFNKNFDTCCAPTASYVDSIPTYACDG